MPNSHSLILAAICRALHIRFPRSADAPKQIDVHSHDDWSEDFLGTNRAHSAEIGDIYIELWREFANGHKAGKPELANVYREAGQQLTADLKDFSSFLRNKYRSRNLVADARGSAENATSSIAAVQPSE